MSVRRLVFWLHLLTGITAGTVILVMSATGVVLTFEPQIVDYWPSGASGLSPRRRRRPA